MNLDELLDEIFLRSRLKLLSQSRTDVMSMTWYFVKGDEVVELSLPPIFDDPHDRDRLSRAVRQTLKKVDADAYGLAAEAWHIHAADDEEKERLRQEGISNHPNRIEGLIITAGDKENTKNRTYNIKRDYKGKIRSLEFFESSDALSDLSSEGRYHNLMIEVPAGVKN